MKKTIQGYAVMAMVGLGGLVSQADVILAGWDGAVDPKTTTFRTADVRASGFVGTNSWNATDASHWGNFVNVGSDDLTFGSLASGARESTTAATGAFLTKVNVPVWMDYTLVNNTAQAYELTAFVFDAWRMNLQASPGYSLSIVAGDLALTNGIATGSFASKGGAPLASADYDDFDISLTGLADRTLGAGKSVTFRLDFQAGGATASNLYLDNVAVLAVIPEPATLGMVGFAAAGLLAIRRLAL